jgi:hypothetical protein
MALTILQAIDGVPALVGARAQLDAGCRMPRNWQQSSLTEAILMTLSPALHAQLRS